MSNPAPDASRHPSSRFRIEMLSNLGPRTTGIEGVVLWVAAGEFLRTDAHRGPRLVVVLGESLTAEGLEDAVSVTLGDPPCVIGKLPGLVEVQVVEFVARNRGPLLRHWHGEIDTKEMVDGIERV